MRAAAGVAAAAGAAAAWTLPAPAPLIPSLCRSLGIVRDLGGGRPVVALTFDDGPHPSGTPAVLDALQAGGIQARPLWPPLHRQAPYTRAERLGGGVADDLYTRGISLPSSVGLTAEDQERVIEVLRGAVL